MIKKLPRGLFTASAILLERQQWLQDLVIVAQIDSQLFVNILMVVSLSGVDKLLGVELV